ncbi:hypothetical protein [Tumebacillus permanentifrigoris]|uniref:Uncharacterized protein n=1 Tax=Tumebacillus permanentifrigoris TaxID=378543 RepID=A0A316DCD7_9BACL|nr:hypothetical protein [Tumebacillus permanentifrigoris]PWK15615.1 hypothetical protein C7459_103155 [Tumebacillus permanentifrigoris]
MKKLVGTIALTLLISMVGTSAFATGATSGVSVPHKATATELANAQASLIQAIPASDYEVRFPNKKRSITPTLVSPLFSYSGLRKGNYIDTIATYGVTTDGEQVVVKVVQYPMDGLVTSHVVTSGYQLVAQGPGTTTGIYTLKGNYTSSNISFSFYNVPHGQYKLRIWNLTQDTETGDMEGNGYVYYY